MYLHKCQKANNIRTNQHDPNTQKNRFIYLALLSKENRKDYDSFNIDAVSHIANTKISPAYPTFFSTLTYNLQKRPYANNTTLHWQNVKSFWSSFFFNCSSILYSALYFFIVTSANTFSLNGSFLYQYSAIALVCIFFCVLLKFGNIIINDNVLENDDFFMTTYCTTN